MGWSARQFEPYGRLLTSFLSLPHSALQASVPSLLKAGCSSAASAPRRFLRNRTGRTRTGRWLKEREQFSSSRNSLCLCAMPMNCGGILSAFPSISQKDWRGTAPGSPLPHGFLFGPRLSRVSPFLLDGLHQNCAFLPWAKWVFLSIRNGTFAENKRL